MLRYHLEAILGESMDHNDLLWAAGAWAALRAAALAGSTGLFIVVF
jgi:hypothetical protein